MPKKIYGSCRLAIKNNPHQTFAVEVFSTHTKDGKPCFVIALDQAKFTAERRAAFSPIKSNISTFSRHTKIQKMSVHGTVYSISNQYILWRDTFRSKLPQGAVCELPCIGRPISLDPKIAGEFFLNDQFTRMVHDHKPLIDLINAMHVLEPAEIGESMDNNNAFMFGASEAQAFLYKKGSVLLRDEGANWKAVLAARDEAQDYEEVRRAAAVRLPSASKSGLYNRNQKVAPETAANGQENATPFSQQQNADATSFPTCNIL